MALTEVVGSPTPASARDPEPRRWADHLPPRVVNVLTVLGFGVPVSLSIWLVSHYGVNVVEGDQWDDVTVIRNSYAHVFDWGSLWAQHNENRIFFPNLIVIALSRTSHFNVRVEEFLSLAMLLAATALVILTHRRRSPGTPWLYYCPVAFLMLSLCQYGNMLWGFQMAWFLVLVSMALSLFLVDRLQLTVWTYLGAMTAAVIGSFSSLQGLLIWPVGLLLLYHRRRVWKFVVPWIVVGAASAGLYLHNFNTHEAAAPHNAVLHHLMGSAKFYSFEIGDVLGIPFHYHQAGNNWISLFGLVIIVLAVLAIAAYGIRRDDHGGGPFGVALILMGLLFAATVTEGRVIFGYWAASASRYTTFDLLVPVGIYLALLDRPGLTARSGSAAERLPGTVPAEPATTSTAVLESEPAASRTALTTTAVPDSAQRIGLRVARIAILVVIVAQFAVSLPNGIRGGRSNYVYQAQGAKVLRNIDHESDNQVVYYLYVFSKASHLRRQADVLRRHHLSVFADGGSGP